MRTSASVMAVARPSRPKRRRFSRTSRGKPYCVARWPWAPKPSTGTPSRFSWRKREGVDRIALRVDPLDVVVVVEEDRLRVGLVGPAERVGDVAGADGAQPDRVSQRAVVVEGLVDDVPGPDPAAEVAGDGEDVLAQDAAQLLPGPGALGQPRRQLAVPDQDVAAHLLPVLPSEGHQLLGLGEVEAAAFGLDGIPL